MGRVKAWMMDREERAAAVTRHGQMGQQTNIMEDILCPTFGRTAWV